MPICGCTVTHTNLMYKFWPYILVPHYIIIAVPRWIPDPMTCMCVLQCSDLHIRYHECITIIIISWSWSGICVSYCCLSLHMYNEISERKKSQQNQSSCQTHVAYLHTVYIATENKALPCGLELVKTSIFHFSLNWILNSTWKKTHCHGGARQARHVCCRWASS